MLKEIGEFIEDHTTLVVGTTLQIGHRLQSGGAGSAPDDCVLIQESGASGVIFDLPDRVDKAIQVLSRAKVYTKAGDLAQEVFDALHGTAGWTAPILLSAKTYEIQVIEALNAPQYIGADEQGRHEFSFTLIFKMKDATK
jgi:hypothetical protein